MQIRSLETLVRIAQVQSFSRAAELLNMTLPALSMQMKTLETDLRAALFDRSTRPPQLTPLGRRVADQARRVLAEQDRLTELCASDDGLNGRFNIGIIQTASVRILPRFLADVARTAPGADFRFSSGLSETLGAMVHSGQLDAAIITRAAPDLRGLTYDVIATEPMFIATPLHHADSSLNDLARSLPFIHFTPASGIGKLISRALDHFPAEPQGIVILDSVEASVESVKYGLGYTILPLPDLERYGEGQLHIRRHGDRPMSRDIALITRATAANDTWRGHLLGRLRAAI
ncbi:transcriptional regulator, LysR family [Roseovarius azorensis]|uniref:Transcriptional regulator, LysR family n=1 Tax=Roseovarius azorensis TaxID=1287727 RepID=A0A1H7F7A2_9RHOB|nr:LysR family transcriptional regulator [Roseovarius azorensis]SEK21674.1 transcriptional regulator, LysR family [Roseovarius azorensis]